MPENPAVPEQKFVSVVCVGHQGKKTKSAHQTRAENDAQDRPSTGQKLNGKGDDGSGDNHHQRQPKCRQPRVFQTVDQAARQTEASESLRINCDGGCQGNYRRGHSQYRKPGCDELPA